jgi:hypothetical protein
LIAVAAAGTDWAAVSAVIAFSSLGVTVGVLVGKTVLNQLHSRGTRLDAEEKRHGDESQMRSVIVGVPASDYGPRQPGLIEITRDLQRSQIELVEAMGTMRKDIASHRQETAAHQQDDLKVAQLLHEHISDGHAANGHL